MTLDEIKQKLFDNRTRLYCILDGVLVPDLPNRLYSGQIPSYCLFTGDLPPDMVYAAPYLAYLSPDSKFADWVLSEGIGKHWGIFIHSRRSIIEMRRHFTALTQVYDERGNPIRFRYYDPRVLRKFLPTCNGGELKLLFGETDALFAESDDGAAVIRYRIADGKLETRLLNEER